MTLPGDFMQILRVGKEESSEAFREAENHELPLILAETSPGEKGKKEIRLDPPCSINTERMKILTYKRSIPFHLPLKQK